MDEKKRNINREDHRNIIDLTAALEEKERVERIEEKKQRKAERPALWKRIVSMLLVAAIVFAAVGLTIYWDDINFDAIRREISYIGTNQDDAGQTVAFQYDRGNNDCFAGFGKYLVHASNKKTVVYDHHGNELFEGEVQLETPVIDVGGSAAVVYDVGGRNLLAFDEKGEKLRISLDEGLGIYSATMNQSNWLAVTSQKKSQRGCVTVYNANMEKVFEFDSTTRFVLNAYVTEDCKYMVAHTLGQENGIFTSKMIIYKLDREEPFADFSLENTMVLSIGSLNGQTLCIGDREVVFASPDGKVNATYQYEFPYLRDFSDEGDGFVAMALNRHRAGTNGKLITLGADGEILAELDIAAEVLDLSAAGRYIAVLYADKLVVYNRDLTEYAVFTQTDRAEASCMREDGSVWLIATSDISLLIP